MELRQLRYFVSIAALQHFRKAAMELNVAQPALSRQIKLLEQELGGSLFERLPRGVRLTETGEAFLEDAKRILQNLDDAVGRTRCLASGHAGSLRVSFTEASSWGGIVPETIMTFRSAEPGVQMILLPLDSATQLAGLQDRTIDAAFLYEDQDFAPQIQSRRMETERIMVAVPPGHRLSRRRSVQLADLIGQPVIWTQAAQNPRFHQRLMTACIAGGLVPRIVQEASTLAILLSLVEVGVGFGFIPVNASANVRRSLTLKPVSDLDLLYPVVLAWSQDNRSAALARLISVAAGISDRNVLLSGTSEGRPARSQGPRVRKAGQP